jgi:hypothetical protein
MGIIIENINNKSLERLRYCLQTSVEYFAIRKQKQWHIFMRGTAFPFSQIPVGTDEISFKASTLNKVIDKCYKWFVKHGTGK